MPLKKSAPFGTLPVQHPAQAPGPHSLRAVQQGNGVRLAASVERLAASLQAAQGDAAQKVAGSIEQLAETVRQQGPQRPSHLPSDLAFKIIARLNQVRDPLCDQEKPTFKDINMRLQAEKDAASTEEVCKAMASQHPELAQEMLRHFALLVNRSDFENERRRRLVDLATFEWKVLNTVV